MADSVHADYFFVPTDFPRPSPVLAAIEGRLTDDLEEHDGKVYAVGSSPRSMRESWEICEELAQHLVRECHYLVEGPWAHLSEEDILMNQLIRMNKFGWGTECEMNWVIHRVAAILKWKEPVLRFH